MKSRNNKRIHLSKTTKSEILIARLLLACLIFLVLLAEISLGSRTASENKGYFEKAKLNAAERIRGWEPLSSDGKKRTHTDGRSNAGFHFQWPQSAEPPEFDFPRNSHERSEKIKDAITLGKSKLHAEVQGGDDKFIWLEEPLNSTKEVYLRKKVTILLPGERVNMKAHSNFSSKSSWSLRVRAAAVTQDRLDAPLPLNVGFSKETGTKGEIDPNGQHFDILLPTFSEIQRNKPNDYVIEWPSTNSGILVIDGLKPDDSNKLNTSSTHKNLIVHIDQMGTSLAGLKNTIKTIKGLSSDQQGTILIDNAVPSSTEAQISKEALLVNRNPIDLGATLDNPNLKELISKDYFLVKRAIQQGGSARKIVLNSGTNCQSSCEKEYSSTAGDSEFTTTLVINRKEEFESTKRYIRNDELITHPGLLYVEINNPSETLRLNSETKNTSQASFFTWVVSGLLKPFGYANDLLQSEEKTAQLDNWLSKLMESFLVTSQSANIALVLHDNSQPLSFGRDRIKSSVTRGEILLHLNELSDENNQKDEVHKFNEPVSSLSVMRIFGRRAFSSQKVADMGEFIPELKNDALAVSQLQHNHLITLTPAGWLMDPIPNGESTVHNYMAIAAPEKIHEIQELSNKMRQRNRLVSLNVAFPGSNLTDEAIESIITTSSTPISCESPNEGVLAKVVTAAQNSAGKQVIVTGSRAPSTLWHIRCLLDGRISTHTQLKLRFSVNGQAVSRESFGLGEYLHPVRGFLWHSPESLELTGAQILEATSALSAPALSAESHTKVNIWTDRFPTSTHPALPSLALKIDTGNPTHETGESPLIKSKLSERK